MRKIYLKLHTQLLIVFIALTIFPLTIFSIIIYKNVTAKITNQAQSYFVQSVQKSSKLIDKELDYIEEFSQKLNIDERLYKVFDDLDTEDELDLMRANTTVTSIINGYKPWYSNIYSAHMVTSYYRFGQENQNYYPKGSFASSLLSIRAKEANGVLRWIPTFSYTEMFGIDNLTDAQLEYGHLYAAVCQMNFCDVTSGKVLRLAPDVEKPILVISFKEQDLLTQIEEYSREDIANEAEYIVMDNIGTVVCSSSELYGVNHPYEAEWLDALETNKGYGYTIERIEDKDYLITYSKSTVTDWLVVARVPVKTLTGEISDKILKLMMVVMLILLLLSIASSYIISKHLNNKIYATINMIDKVGTGEFDSLIEYDPKEEFAFFYSKLNEMSENLKNLVHENYEVKLQQREFEILILNIQLNPHFVYNALNIINWICLSKDTEKASRMIVDLSRMLQYTSQNTRQKVMLQDDIDWLRRYIYIMQMRYDNRFLVKFRIPEELMRNQVPKLFLQPMVENTIVHGFRNLEEMGHLEITAEYNEHDITFIVEDNGCGMTQQRIREIMEFTGTSIGLANTDRRIKILYGSMYGIGIHSQLGEGTMITITIPKQIL